MALDNKQRIAMFLIGCVGARLGLVYAALVAPTKILSIILGIIGTGFALIWIMGWRKTGLETGGQPIWWNHLIPLHALAYLTSAVLLWFGYRQDVAVILLWDLTLGLTSFLFHHKLLQ
jgi:disulfide bond formation protein DsbB